MKILIIFTALVLMMNRGWSQDTPGETGPLLIQLVNSKPDTTRMKILLQLTRFYFYKSSLNHLDSVNIYLQQARQLNRNLQRNDFQNQIGIFSAKYYCALNPGADAAKKAFAPVIDTCKKTGDIISEGDAWSELAESIGYDPKDASFKITCYENAMALARQRSDKGLEMVLLRYKADIHFQQKKFDSAENELFQILKEEHRISPVQLMFTYDLLTAVYVQKGVFDKALSYALKTQKMMGITGDSVYAYTFNSRLSAIYKSLGKLPEAIEWQKKLVNATNWNNFPVLVGYSIRQIAGLSIDAGKPREALIYILEEIKKRKPVTVNDKRIIQHALGDCYNALKQFKLAEKCYLDMIRFGNEDTINIPSHEKGYDYITIGHFNYDQGKYTRARQYFGLGLMFYEKYGSLQHIMNSHTWLFRADSALGNNSEAIKQLLLSNRLKDSIFSIARNKQIEELQIVYETEQKDKNFKILEGKQRLTQFQLRHTQTTRNWIIAGALLVLCIAGLIYRQSVLRKRNNLIVKDKNAQLQHLVTEKEWLLKEIHHRVKNNFQTVMSLLGTQSGYLVNEEAKNAMSESQQRILAMSLIHQRLYQSNNLSSIRVTDYIYELVDSLSESFNTGNRIRFALDLEPIDIDLAHCIPLGLILNESITNSIKYAFPNQQQGNISISLHYVSEHRLLLTIKDNGVGLPDGFSATQSDSMGMNLMRGLSSEIGAQFKISSENGTSIEIRFEYHPEYAVQILA